ncbi:MAG: fasciclin domain-containing protein [Rhizomicrobium sp.]
MTRLLSLAAAAALLVSASGPALAADMGMHSMNGMTHVKTAGTIVSGVVASADHTTLAAAVKAAGLMETLSGKGPFTLFAPTNQAFNALPAGTLASLLKPQNKEELVKILTYHVIAGRFDARAVIAAIKKGGGKAVLKTVEGEPLTATLEHGKVVLTDAKGGKATVTKANIRESNGVIHVINAVLMP